jgi:hypothetical protein
MASSEQKSMIIRYTMAWIPMILIGISNGILRESTYGKYLDELRAHQISTLTGILLFSLYIGTLVHFWGLESASQAITIGLIWLILTVAFEFLFGHFIAGYSWSRLLQDYNILAGRVWILVLFAITFTPFLFYKLIS